jgi:T5SS/PEP-CTERM-associated repeat protein
MSLFQWIGADKNGVFGDAINWVNATNPAIPGPPGTSDVAVIVATGNISGSGSVAQLILDGSTGPLTTTASIDTGTLTLAGTVGLTTGSVLDVTAQVAGTGTSTVVASGGSDVDIAGSDGTTLQIASASTDKCTFNITGLGSEVEAEDGNVVIGGAGTGNMTVSAGANLASFNSQLDGTGDVDLGGSAGGDGVLVVTGMFSSLQAAGG